MDEKILFFTEWKYIPPYAYFNKGINKIRLSKKIRRKIRYGNDKSINLVTRQFHKFNKVIMVFRGICNDWFGEIIFHAGNL